jgi:hypothetical protein
VEPSDRRDAIAIALADLMDGARTMLERPLAALCFDGSLSRVDVRRERREGASGARIPGVVRRCVCDGRGGGGDVWWRVMDEFE